MTELYTTLWLIMSAYAAPLGYYGDVSSCQAVADTIALAEPAQIVCVPSNAANPLAFNGLQPTMTAPQSGPQAAIADIAKVSQEGNPFIGDPDAPVTIAYWFDYQCPYCKQVEDDVFPQIILEYVDTGKVKIVFKDFQFLGPDSQAAGLVGRAVWETAPEKFGAWHKAVFDRQDEENGGWGNMNDLVALTKSIEGIDVSKIETLISSEAATYQLRMQGDAQEGNAMGAGGTPSFLIGTEMLVGAQPYQQLSAAIEGALKRK